MGGFRLQTRQLETNLRTESRNTAYNRVDGLIGVFTDRLHLFGDFATHRSLLFADGVISESLFTTINWYSYIMTEYQSPQWSNYCEMNR